MLFENLYSEKCPYPEAAQLCCRPAAVAISPGIVGQSVQTLSVTLLRAESFQSIAMLHIQVISPHLWQRLPALTSYGLLNTACEVVHALSWLDAKAYSSFGVKICYFAVDFCIISTSYTRLCACEGPQQVRGHTEICGDRDTLLFCYAVA